MGGRGTLKYHHKQSEHTESRLPSGLIVLIPSDLVITRAVHGARGGGPVSVYLGQLLLFGLRWRWIMAPLTFLLQSLLWLWAASQHRLE